MGSTSFHESPQDLRPITKDRHRAIVSLMEELEAVDWYDQRADAAGDDELRSVLEHNRDEEKEHAVMTLEWLRRHDPVLDRYLRQYLFTEGSITAIEEEGTGGGGRGNENVRPENGRAGGPLRLGSLRTRS